ncbi:phage minor head protein [Lactococcus lactis]|uniref:phage minor head protein n=1 Tax=Lactococcus lactis TaxID=1358 RepID=UPI00223B77F0|nr:phage minor head protein [Lactococcus lactis]MCT0049168.1 phage capsid protein [Lactococcus lactis subsp. lactis]
MNDAELIQKSLELSAEEKEELIKLLRKAGFSFTETLADNISDIEQELEDILQEDYEQVAPILEELAQKDKKPSRKMILAALAARVFISKMSERVNPKIKLSYVTLFDKFNSKYKGKSEFNPKSRHSKEIDKWLKGLPKLMDLTSKERFIFLVQSSYDEGKGIKWLERNLSKLDEFGHSRARTTSITEVLRMYSGSQYEAMMSNPNIVGKEWRHTSGIGEPRMSHGQADGTVVAVDDFFIIDGERARYPRDPQLSPGNSISCHCFMNPVLADKYTKN